MPKTFSPTEIVVACRRGHPKELAEVLKPYLLKARWITRSIDPFIDLENTLEGGPEMPAGALAVAEIIMDIHPDFRALLDEFSNEEEDSEAYPTFLSLMSKNMNNARATDTNLFRYNILSFLRPNPFTPITTKEKDTRGWHHKWTSRALCPFKDLEIFDENPIAYMKKVERGQLKPTAGDLPAFLYPEEVEYDPAHPDQGLFRSTEMVKGLRLIYTGVSSVEDGRRAKTRKSQAELHGMSKVTPRMVAYTACQIYFSLSSTSSWETKLGRFDLYKLFRIILSLFESDPSSAWAVETLEYLTNELPSLKRVTKRSRKDTSDSEVESDDEDPTGILKARAAARNAECAQRRDALEAEAQRERERENERENAHESEHEHESEHGTPVPDPQHGTSDAGTQSGPRTPTSDSSNPPQSPVAGTTAAGLEPEGSGSGAAVGRGGAVARARGRGRGRGGKSRGYPSKKAPK